jgi:hypothetical protein
MDLQRSLVRIALWSGAAIAVALAAVAYFRPEFVVDLANQVMLCF